MAKTLKCFDIVHVCISVLIFCVCVLIMYLSVRLIGLNFYFYDVFFLTKKMVQKRIYIGMTVYFYYEIV